MCFSFCRETDSGPDIGSAPESGAPESGAPDNGADNGADHRTDTESEPGTVDDMELVVSLCCC